ncbi:transposase [Corynebacterium sp. zg254]|uniref:Transposase n=1 Tax=Corynebacterium zhongnanshanii TaxID=2768834 RepID=A0ABQ6VE54_9CORY|nr:MULTISPECIES: integrase core domain-containing protein [Corynebacterium]KAB3520967.1 transposase [Corynebacterium zhongnanshanii]MCR5914599.1 transposase [Corynebacterium sp. zg254]
MSIVYNDRLAEKGIVASTGAVGDSFDYALADNVNRSYKNELIHTKKWSEVTEVEIATCDWVNWCNEIRLQQTLGYRTPVDVGEELWAGNLGQEIMDITAHV